MINIHDNEILSYEIDFKNQKIVIHTESTFEENADIFFTDVLTHFFETQIKHNIIFDIEKYELFQFIEDNRDLLISQKKYGWPTDYDTIEELAEKLQKEQYFYYIICSSLGLCGWVLAKNYEVVPAK